MAVAVSTCGIWDMCYSGIVKMAPCVHMQVVVVSRSPHHALSKQWRLSKRIECFEPPSCLGEEFVRDLMTGFLLQNLNLMSGMILICASICMPPVAVCFFNGVQVRIREAKQSAENGSVVTHAADVSFRAQLVDALAYIKNLLF